MRGLGVILLGALFVSCASPAPTATAPAATPTTAPTPTRTPAPTPTAAPTPDLPSLPLPANVSGIPPGGEPRIEAHTPPGSVSVGVQQSYTLAHCGLFSPIDIDGSLWDPTFGDDGSGGPPTQDQLGDLINSTPVALVLIDHETMLMVTQHGARVVLTRHDGPRAYFGCD